MSIFKYRGVAALMVAASVSACAVRAPVLSSEDWQKRDGGAVQANQPEPRKISFKTVKENVDYGHLMMRLYDEKALVLGDDDFAMSIPVFALAATSISMLAFGTDAETAAGVGLGAGALEVGRRQLDFAGRAKVLSDGVVSWKCFKEKASTVGFLDHPNPDRYAKKIEDAQKTLKDRIQDADEAIGKIDPSQSGNAQAIEALREARTAAQQALPVAGRTITAAKNALVVLDDERFLMESAIRHKYAGVVKPFDASSGRQMVIGAFKQVVADQAATADIHRSFARSTAQSATVVALTGNTVAVNLTKKTTDVSQLIQELRDAAEEITSADSQALLNLPTELTSCPR